MAQEDRTAAMFNLAQGSTTAHLISGETFAAEVNESMSWRENILTQLHRRNEQQRDPFRGYVASLQRLRDGAAALRTENAHLTFINDKLRRENVAQRQSSSASVAVGGCASAAAAAEAERAQLLEKKLLAVQEELTELHRRKGENAQQVIDLTAQLKIAEQDSSAKDDEVRKFVQEIDILHIKISNLTSAIKELEDTNQLLKDEYQTLQLALNTAERKLVEAQKQNDGLVAQIMEFKERDVERMNLENDIFRLQQQKIVQQQLEEAAKDMNKVVVQQKRSSSSSGAQAETVDALICVSVRLPTKAYLRFDAHDGEVNAISWSPHGLVVATGGADRKIKLWEISKGTSELKSTLTGSNGAIMSLDFDAAGTLLLGSSGDFASRVWTVDDSRLRHTLTGHSGKVLSAKFLTDNKVVSGSHDRTLRVWDLRSKACISTKFAGSSCNDLVATAEQSVVSGHFDKKIRFWDLRSAAGGGSEPTAELSLGGKVTSVDLSRDSRHLIAAARDDALHLVDLRKQTKVLASFRSDGFHLPCDWSRAQFSPDSEFIAAGSADGSVHIWSKQAPDCAKVVLSEHEASVVSVAWQPAGNCLTSCDKNKNVVVWGDI